MPCSTLSAITVPGKSSAFPAISRCPFFKEIEDSAALPLHGLSHELAIGLAADASARFRASISVAAVTWGAGAFTLVNPTAGASPPSRRAGLLSEHGEVVLGSHFGAAGDPSITRAGRGIALRFDKFGRTLN